MAMSRLKFIHLALIAVLCSVMSSCDVLIPASVSYNEYRAGVVPVSSVGLKDANYKILKPLTASCNVMTNGENICIVDGKLRILVDGNTQYEYTYLGSYDKILTSFDPTSLSLGIIDGFPTLKNIREPELEVLAQQVALGKIIKELIKVGGDAITYPVIEVNRKHPLDIAAQEVIVNVSTYAIKLNPSK